LTAVIDTLSLPDALPISRGRSPSQLVIAFWLADDASLAIYCAASMMNSASSQPNGVFTDSGFAVVTSLVSVDSPVGGAIQRDLRSEEHTSELQSRGHLVC